MSNHFSIVFLIISFLSLCYSFANYTRKKRSSVRSFPFPPGPKGWPIIGNLLDMPNKREWLTYSNWKNVYGNIIGLRVFGQPIVVLNSASVVDALLEKRNAVYSDRPCMAVLTELCRCGWFMTTLPYGEELFIQRKMMTRFMNVTALKSYYDVIREKMMGMIERTVVDPDRFQHHNLHTVGSIMMKLAYDHEVSEENDPFVPLLQQITRSFIALAAAGAHPVDLFPKLARLPPIIFGIKFAKELKSITRLGREILDLPYESARERMRDGKEENSSMLASLITLNTTKDGQLLHERSIKAASAITYLAGTDTTVSAIDSFVLAMMLHPEVQRKAQREIDEGLQGRKFLEMSDRESLIYVEAILLEVLRWNPVAPLSLPHKALKDDEYNGMFIPAGTVIIPNSWQCMHDEETYPDPLSFNPDRFIDEDTGKINHNVVDPRKYVFGYGRRVCPGRHLAETMLWTAITHLLISFEISPPVDANKQPIMPDLVYESSVAASRPKPYKARFTSRIKEPVIGPGSFQ